MSCLILAVPHSPPCLSEPVPSWINGLYILTPHEFSKSAVQEYISRSCSDGLSREGTRSFLHGTRVMAGLAETKVLLITVVPCLPLPRLLYWMASSKVIGGLVMADSNGLLPIASLSAVSVAVAAQHPFLEPLPHRVHLLAFLCTFLFLLAVDVLSSLTPDPCLQAHAGHFHHFNIHTRPEPNSSSTERASSPDFPIWGSLVKPDSWSGDVAVTSESFLPLPVPGLQPASMVLPFPQRSCFFSFPHRPPGHTTQLSSPSP